jgi:hypothetical protein
MDQRTQRIRQLNDQLRKRSLAVTVVMSPGVSDLGEESCGTHHRENRCLR